MKELRPFLLAGVLLGTSLLRATPSTQIWIPSADVQPFGVPHFGFDTFLRSSGHGYFQAGERDPDLFDAGLTIGVLPFRQLQMELGVDYLSTLSGSKYDDHPVYFNAKLGVPENVFFTNAPAAAIGGYNLGTKRQDATRTDQDIVYGLLAKTVPLAGRFSAGYYAGNDETLTGPGDSKGHNHGVLLSWDRTMSEIDDRLWLAVDYQGGQNAMGALSIGVAWAFTPNLSLIVGYDLWNKKSVAGSNTVTTQVDVNF